MDCSHSPLLWKGCGTAVGDRWGRSASASHGEQFAGPTGEIWPTGEGSELPAELGPRDGAFIYVTGVSKAVTCLVCHAPRPISHQAILGGGWAGSPPPLCLEGSLPPSGGLFLFQVSAVRSPPCRGPARTPAVPPQFRLPNLFSLGPSCIFLLPSPALCHTVPGGCLKLGVRGAT